MGGIEDYKREQRLVGEFTAAIERSGESPEIVFWALRGTITDLMARIDADRRVKFAAQLRCEAGDMLDCADMIAALMEQASK